MHFVWFSMRDGFFSPRVSESRPSRGGIRRRVVRNPSRMENHFVWFSISVKPYKMHFLVYFTLWGTLKSSAKLLIMNNMRDGFISQLFSAWGNVRSMREASWLVTWDCACKHIFIVWNAAVNKAVFIFVVICRTCMRDMTSSSIRAACYEMRKLITNMIRMFWLTLSTPPGPPANGMWVLELIKIL